MILCKLVRFVVILVENFVFIVLLMIWWLYDRFSGIIKCGLNFLLFYLGFILDLDIFNMVIFGVFIIGVNVVLLILFKLEMVNVLFCMLVVLSLFLWVFLDVLISF